MSTVFGGFPARSRFIPLPDAFFTTLLRDIEDAAELKATLYVLRAIFLRRGYPRFLIQADMESQRDLVEMVGGVEKLRQALAQAARRGTVLRLAVNRDGGDHVLYFINDNVSRAAVEKIVKGQLSLGDFSPLPSDGTPPEPTPNIFALYEKNIGLLTPMVAEELKQAEKQYPASWIEEAFREAVAQNRRRWSYISRILERWATEGRGDGTSGRRTEEDPDRYIKGRYGHIVRR